MIVRILCIVATVLLPVSVSAHGDRPSLETETGGYVIDIGYDREGIRPGEEVTFDFDLITAGNRPAFVPFQTVEIVISNGDTVVVDEILPNDGKHIPTLPVTFAEKGEYDMYTAFMQSGAIVAQSTFDLTVDAAQGTVARLLTTITYIAAFGLLVFTVFVVTTSYRKQS